ncbi:MAG: HIT family protein [Rhodocyclaceae bacterium]|nr:HIT family protein [Rhodocyclaceae bacterium]
MDDCVFCRIVRGEIPSTRVWEDDLTVAFMDIGSVNPGHLLVATKAHAENLYGLDDGTAAAVMRSVARVGRAVQSALSPDGLSLYQANGAAAGQTVFHFHVHVLPRWKGDAMDLVWPVRNPGRQELEETAARIRAAL